jgi:hypothetical protein
MYNMKTTKNLYTAFSFKAITNEPVELGMWNAVRKQIRNIPINFV